jgi:hypothetical protein
MSILDRSFRGGSQQLLEGLFISAALRLAQFGHVAILAIHIAGYMSIPPHASIVEIGRHQPLTALCTRVPARTSNL